MFTAGRPAVYALQKAVGDLLTDEGRPEWTGRMAPAVKAVLEESEMGAGSARAQAGRHGDDIGNAAGRVEPVEDLRPDSGKADKADEACCRESR